LPEGNLAAPPSGGLQGMFDKLLRRQRINKVTGVPTGEMEFSPGKVAAAIGLGSYLSGAFENQPQDVFTPTYNLAVADLQNKRGGFKYIDPVDGTEKTFEQVYIPEGDPKNQGDFRMGSYAIEKNRLKEGGLAEVIAGGNPNSMKDMREKGAQYFYEQQKRYKRVFDLLEGSRNAKAQIN
jgi:hypothetical protein